MNIDHDTVLVFQSGPILFGVPIDLVQGVIPACEISPLPGAPAAVEGVFTLGGEIIAIVDPLHAFFSDRATRLDLRTRFLLVKTSRRKLALTVERVDGVASHPPGSAEAVRQITSGMAQLREIAATSEGLVYITDPDALLSESDEVRLSGAIVALAHTESAHTGAAGEQ